MSELSRPHPLWLSQEARAEVDALAQKFPGLDWAPSTLVVAGDEGEMRALVWVKWGPKKAVWVRTGMKAQLFSVSLYGLEAPVPLEEGLEELAILQLRDKLVRVAAGVEGAGSAARLYQLVRYLKESHRRILLHGGMGSRHGGAIEDRLLEGEG